MQIHEVFQTEKRYSRVLVKKNDNSKFLIEQYNIKSMYSLIGFHSVLDLRKWYHKVWQVGILNALN
jgi:hypothetical protein